MPAKRTNVPVPFIEINTIPEKINIRVEAAIIESFSQASYEEVNLAQIAKSANISLSTIYKYYKNKEGLFFCYINLWHDELLTRMDDHLNGMKNWEERLRKIFWLTLDYFEQRPKQAKVMISSLNLLYWFPNKAHNRPTHLDYLKSMIEQCQKENVMRNDLDAITIMDAIHGIIIRRISMRDIRNSPRPITYQSDLLFDMLWKGIKA